MRLGNFSVLVPEGREHGTGHVGLNHSTVYTIRLGNHGSVDCDADVEVDGKSVGCFRLHAYQSVCLERPADDTGRFTFFRSESAESQQAGEAGIARESKGLVRVTFKPARKPQHVMRPMGMVSRGGPCGQSVGGDYKGIAEEKTSGRIQLESMNASAGITGLTGTSGQRFVTVANLDYDLSAVVEIALRLVCKESSAVRPLQPIRSTGIPGVV